MYRRRSRRGGGQLSIFSIIMIFQEIARYMGIRQNTNQPLPVVTFSLIGICVGLHYFRREIQMFFPMLMLDSYALSMHIPSVLYGFQFIRLFSAAFFHASDMHLWYNMISLMWKGTFLEDRMDPTSFSVLALGLIIASHAMMIPVAFALSFMGFPEYFYQRSVGFSGTLFALKAIANYFLPMYSNVLGFRLPTKYLVWVELLFVQLLLPNASFIGHLGGILAGYGYLFIQRPNEMKQYLFG